MSDVMEFTSQEAEVIGRQIGVDFGEVDLEQFRIGLAVELEHGSLWGGSTNITGDDPKLTGRIVWAHLKEIPDYYTRLKRMEKAAGS
jgi:hypothetical protein